MGCLFTLVEKNLQPAIFVIFLQLCKNFFPNEGSIRKRAVTPKVASVHSMIQIKKNGYPKSSCSFPAIIPGNIIPSAIKAVQMA